MAYRNKTYLCFDGDEDIKYYNMMKAWKANDNIDFNFHDAHVGRNSKDSSLEETIKRSLRERMNTSNLFIVLVGEKTKNLFTFVRWEIELALEKNLPIVVVNLNGELFLDEDLCPPILRDKLAVHIAYEKDTIQLAIAEWPKRHCELQDEKESGPHDFSDIWGDAS